jgi:hypothetical protein
MRLNPAASILVLTALLSGCSEQTVSPSDFVKAHADYAHRVVVSGQEVEGGIGILTEEPGSADTSTLAAFDSLLSDAQASLEAVNKNLLSAPKPAGFDSSGVEMWSATNELVDAIKSLRAFVDDQKPSDLSSYRDHWNQGRAWWNQAVTPVWQAGGSLPIPTFDNAPKAPPVTK